MDVMQSFEFEATTQLRPKLFQASLCAVCKERDQSDCIELHHFLDVYRCHGNAAGVGAEPELNGIRFIE